MTIYKDWQSFRRGFAFPIAEETLGVNTYAFAPKVGPDLASITAIISGDFIAGGFQDVNTLFVAGSSLNDGEYPIASVPSTTKIEIASTHDFAVEVASAATTELTGFNIDAADKMETWPVSLVRAAGFTGGFAVVPGIIPEVPYTGAPGNILLSVNGAIPDTVFGVDEFDWYVSSRTDDLSLQYFNATSPGELALNSFSGSLTLVQNLPAIAAGTGWDGVPGTLTPAINVKLFKYTDVYARRRSDGAIQWINLLRTMQATA